MRFLCSVNSVRFLHSLPYLFLTKSLTEAQQRPGLSRAFQPPHNKAEFKPRSLCTQRPCSFKGMTEVKSEELGARAGSTACPGSPSLGGLPGAWYFPPVSSQLHKYVCALGTSTQWASALETFLQLKPEETSVVKGKSQVEFCWLQQSTE